MLASLAGARPLRVSDDATPPVSLDPHRVLEWKTDALLGHLFDGLVRFSPDGEILPALALDWRWRGDRSLELQLRSGVRFHDGSSFDAKVVAQNFARVRALGPKGTRWLFFRNVTGVEVLDSDRVRLELAQPDGFLLHKLAAFGWMLPGWISDPARAKDFGRAPVGTGPYRFRSWDQVKLLSLEAFPEHWSQEVGFPDGIEWHFLPPAEQVRQLLQGDIDLVGEVTPIFHRRVQLDPGVRLVKGDTLVSVDVLFNTERPLVREVGFRQAFAKTVHRGDLIRYVARGNGRPMGVTSMEGQFGDPPGDLTHSFDPDGARSLLEGLSPPLRVRGYLDPSFELLGKALVSQLSKVGIELELEVASREVLFKEVAQAKMSSGKVGWKGDLFVFACPDPTYHYAFINLLANHSQSPWSMWSSPQYDSVFAELVAAREPMRAQGLARKLDAMIESEVPFLSLYQVRKGYGVSRRVEYHPNRSGMLDLRTSRWSPTPESRP